MTCSTVIVLSVVSMAWLAGFGLTTGVTLYAAFFPPAFYRRWVNARAAGMYTVSSRSKPSTVPLDSITPITR